MRLETGGGGFLESATYGQVPYTVPNRGIANWANWRAERKPIQNRSEAVSRFIEFVRKNQGPHVD